MTEKSSPLRPALRAAAAGALIGMVALVGIVWASRHGALPWQGGPPVVVRTADFAGETASSDARRLARWVARTGDNRGMNFVILDKKQARVFVFGPDARLRGASPVLLGFAPGDDSVAGIGKRPIAQVRPHERTTPAGRFVAEPGRNTLDEEVIWVDYDAAVSMHRVRATVASERRLERLATPTPDDNRISYGCINVPVTFFEQVLQPAFDKRYGVVYVLPETRALDEVFALGNEAGAAAQPM
ncbi:MAG: hypothetical protein AB7I35_11870 [Ramlibacter sp.]